MDPPDAGTTFVPFARDFAGYGGWDSFFIDGGIAQAGGHLAGDRTIYLNRRPQHGAMEWPVGTLIVKVSTTQTFAMAKRGGGYNLEGTVGWEWFELTGTSEQPVIQWRGVGPPNGTEYGPGDSSCNNCHTGAWENDYVQAAPMQLSGF